MDLQTGCDSEAPVQFLFLGSEERGRLGHRDHLRVIDSIRLSVAHDGRHPICDNVLHPVGALAVGEGNEKTVVVFDRHDRGLIGPTRTATDVTDDRSV